MLEKVVKLSSDISERMRQAKKLRDREDNALPAAAAELTSELECMEKMKRVYQREIVQLNERLYQQTRGDQLSDLESKLNEARIAHERLEKEKKRLQKLVKDCGKALELSSQRLEAGTEKREVLSFIANRNRRKH